MEIEMGNCWVLVCLTVLFGVPGPESQSAAPPKGGGIVFMNTAKLEEMKSFYIDRIGCEMWIDQGSCAILKYGNLLIGFCQSGKPDLDTLITLFYESKKDVDQMYADFEDAASSVPEENLKYRIYHFYARDPEGRSIEFQTFLHPIRWDFKARHEN
jgi:hypothetical protein